MEEIMQAVAILQAGDPERAHHLMRALWEKLEGRGAPIALATLAHFLADSEDDVGKELEWDLLALKAATGGGVGENGDALTPELDHFLPSLHLNVGDALRRSGDLHHGRLHAAFGLERSAMLPDDGYGGTVRQALQRLEARIEAGIVEDVRPPAARSIRPAS